MITTRRTRTGVPAAVVAVSLAAIGVLGAAGSHAAAPAPLDPPAGVSANKVLVIGIDGTRWDELSALMAAGKAPRLAGLAAAGAATPTTLAYSPPAAFTVSQVGWTTIASGVWPAKHGVTDPTNASPGQRTKNGYPDFLARVETAKPSLSTMLVTDWANLGLEQSGGPIFGTADGKRTVAAGTLAEYDAQDDAGATAAADALRRRGPDASFVYFGVVDETGHEDGSGSAAYRDAIVRTDTRIGRLLDAVNARADRARWTILVTTDHGQGPLPGLLAHGGPSTLERTSFVIAAGPGVPAKLTPETARIVDIAPTVLHQLGLPVAAPADLDGTSIVSAAPPAAGGPPRAGCRRSPTGVRCAVRAGTGSPPLRSVRASAAGRRSRTVTAPGDGATTLYVAVRYPRRSRPTRVHLHVVDAAGLATPLTARIHLG